MEESVRGRIRCVEYSQQRSKGPEDPGDPNGKTPEEIAAWCAEYERKQRMVTVEPQRAGIEGIYHATLMYLTCTDVRLAAIRAMAARASTPQTLARKRSKDMHRA